MEQPSISLPAEAEGPIVDLGLTHYQEALKKQRQYHSCVTLWNSDELLIITEHFPVYTCGRAKRTTDHGPRTTDQLHGIPLFHIERGGHITYHGPGQIVGYPILNLAKRRLSIPQYLRKLENSLIEALQEVGIQAEYRKKYLAGLWVGDKKLVSIGIAVRRWTTFHGFALNVDCDLGPFRMIKPCGLAGDRITSLKELGWKGSKEEIRNLLIKKLIHAFF
ncbi:MAG: lipoyl(octanoyl) transferase LipB [Deltaproteobacteria bacterium]|nr:lipoyl(octanoyl) transferase LipB [Deltaproteobacteria bacterium]MBI4223458.1 lipoyl(octanoyl) transferase LipB [Deltaproteobacteria bacterium]